MEGPGAPWGQPLPCPPKFSSLAEIPPWVKVVRIKMESLGRNLNNNKVEVLGGGLAHKHIHDNQTIPEDCQNHSFLQRLFPPHPEQLLKAMCLTASSLGPPPACCSGRVIISDHLLQLSKTCFLITSSLLCHLECIGDSV